MGREQAYIDVWYQGEHVLDIQLAQTLSCSSVLRSTKSTDQSHMQNDCSTLGPHLSSHHQVCTGAVVLGKATLVIIKDPLYYTACLNNYQRSS